MPTKSSLPVALVTGSSSGIGRAVVQELHARQFFVVATMRRPEAAPSEFRDMNNVTVRPLDVVSDESIANLTDWLRDDENVTRLDVVINCAGIGGPGTVETVPIDIAKQVFEVNVWGVARTCKALLPIIRTHGRGGLIAVVSSTLGVRTLPCSDIYAASKFAVEGMMECLRYSVAADNIKISLINPGPVNTHFVSRSHGEQPQSDAERESLAHKMVREGYKYLEKRVASGQTAHSCGIYIADVIERDYRLHVVDANSAAHFWNGTSKESRTVCETVKGDVSGRSSDVYRTAWDLAFDLAKSPMDGN